MVVGIWLPVWKLVLGRKLQKAPESPEQGQIPEQGQEQEQAQSRHKEESSSNEREHENSWNRTWLAASLLGSAMVARGEIGLLIIEIGHNETPYVSEEGFITGVWAILLNTIIGPVTVGVLVRFFGKQLGEGEWGLQELPGSTSRQEETREEA